MEGGRRKDGVYVEERLPFWRSSRIPYLPVPKAMMDALRKEATVTHGRRHLL